MAEMKVWYDKEGDVLEIVFEDTAASMEEVEADFFERITRDGRIIGFSVLNFSKHNRSPLTLPITVTATPA